MSFVIADMNSLRGILLSCSTLSRFSPSCLSSIVKYQAVRPLSISPVNNVENPRHEMSRKKTMQSLQKAETESELISLDALAGHEAANAVEEGEDVQQTFSLHPDETTADQLFNGTPFKDLPYVTLKIHKNNTKLIAR